MKIKDVIKDLRSASGIRYVEVPATIVRSGHGLGESFRWFRVTKREAINQLEQLHPDVDVSTEIVFGNTLRIGR